MNPWLDAFRPRTLPLAVSGIITGSALAAFHGTFKWPVLLLALITAVLLQVLSNLANDLGDHLHGADSDARVGPLRTVQSGAIPAAAMKRAMWICGLLALVTGLALIIVALGWSVTMLGFLLIGLLAIAAAVKYTYGTNPYGYAGLGDISVLVFFGLAGVAGSFFLHTGQWWWPVLLPAFGVGLLSTGMLNLNNMRDAENDAASGKHTIAVRLGARRSKAYHTLLMLGGFACLVLFTAFHFRSWGQYVFLLAFPLLDRHLRAVRRNTAPHELDPQMKVLGLITLLCALLFSLGLLSSP